ncbi:hypothetical protein FA95DRAFT_1575387 [Auriscalpium vulgare]|uniref:Uncharacterized protein n=1 Tax=Auriscalpium vulgare TaxID=40419 RepID=A0ACB8RGI7_9AGAM|nr:hypothetical protein FA95DRAFT_1575387 [Auriscalpium vulgare]
MSVQKGDVLLIPNFFGVQARVTIMWLQHTADYVPIVVYNKSRGDVDVPIFIEAEWFNEAHLDAYELTIDNKFQYGQKNNGGDQRFVVFHDKSRKLNQACLEVARFRTWCLVMIQLFEFDDWAYVSVLHSKEAPPGCCLHGVQSVAEAANNVGKP